MKVESTFINFMLKMQNATPGVGCQTSVPNTWAIEFWTFSLSNFNYYQEIHDPFVTHTFFPPEESSKFNLFFFFMEVGVDKCSMLFYASSMHN